MRRYKYETPNHQSPHAFGMETAPCPFCASGQVQVYVGHRSHCSCMACGTDGPQAEKGADPRAAIELWNRRMKRDQ